jgi:hypothetical protein
MRTLTSVLKQPRRRRKRGRKTRPMMATGLEPAAKAGPATITKAKKVEKLRDEMASF